MLLSYFYDRWEVKTKHLGWLHRVSGLMLTGSSKDITSVTTNTGITNWLSHFKIQSVSCLCTDQNGKINGYEIGNTSPVQSHQSLLGCDIYFVRSTDSSRSTHLAIPILILTRSIHKGNDRNNLLGRKYSFSYTNTMDVENNQRLGEQFYWRHSKDEPETEKRWGNEDKCNRNENEISQSILFYAYQNFRPCIYSTFWKLNSKRKNRKLNAERN